VEAPLALRLDGGLGLATPTGAFTAPVQIGARAALQTAAGGVAAIFTLDGYDKRLRVASYGLRVANNSDATLTCRIWVVSAEGDATLRYPLLFEVAPYTVKSTDVPLHLDKRASFERAIAEVIGEGVYCMVEAAAPVTRMRVRLYPALAAAAFAVWVVAVAASAFAASFPRISAFAAPPMALTGTTVEAEYATSGTGQLSYSVAAPDGRRIQGGSLTENSGAIPIAIPASLQPGAYTLQLAMQGTFSRAKEIRVLNTVPPKVIDRSGAQITDISVDPIVARPGETVAVTYNAAGADGYLRLLGTDGTVWSQKPYSQSGHTTFTVPAVPSAREMRVLLHVIKGRSAAESSAGLVVALAKASTSQVDALGSSSSADTNGTFSLATKSVKSGGSVHVAILSPRNGMRISLTDTQSREVTGVDVGSDASTITLRAPTVTMATRFIVVASFTDGFGQESIVQPITVRP
jgi:hypothetical protein